MLCARTIYLECRSRAGALHFRSIFDDILHAACRRQHFARRLFNAFGRYFLRLPRYDDEGDAALTPVLLAMKYHYDSRTHFSATKYIFFVFDALFT